MPKQTTPSHLWTQLHIIQGESSLAAELASGEIEILETQDFSNLDVAHDFIEYARIAVVTGLAAARSASSWQESSELLERVVSQVGAWYPESVLFCDSEILGKKKSQRDVYWQEGFGSSNIFQICARDVLHVVQFLALFLSESQAKNSKLEAYRDQLQQKILVSEEASITRQIFLIEEGTYSQAKDAFGVFVADARGVKSAIAPDQSCTVVSRMMGRAYDAQDTKTVTECFSFLVNVSTANASLEVFIQKEIQENMSRIAKQKTLEKKITEWSEKTLNVTLKFQEALAARLCS